VFFHLLPQGEGFVAFFHLLPVGEGRDEGFFINPFLYAELTVKYLNRS